MVAPEVKEVMYDTQQQSILQGSKVSFTISLQSYVFATRHCSHPTFNLNAKQQRRRFLCLPFTVALPQQMPSSSQYICLFLCLLCFLQLADWYFRFLPNMDGSSFRSCLGFQDLCSLLPPAVIVALFCD